MNFCHTTNFYSEHLSNYNRIACEKVKRGNIWSGMSSMNFFFFGKKVSERFLKSVFLLLLSVTSPHRRLATIWLCASWLKYGCFWFQSILPIQIVLFIKMCPKHSVCVSRSKGWRVVVTVCILAARLFLLETPPCVLIWSVSGWFGSRVHDIVIFFRLCWFF